MVPLPEPLGPSMVTMGVICSRSPQSPGGSAGDPLSRPAIEGLLQGINLQSNTPRSLNETRKRCRHVRDVADLERAGRPGRGDREGHGDPMIAATVDAAAGETRAAPDPQ